MNIKATTLFAVALALPGLLSSAGCLRAAKEVAEEAIAEAVVTQSISGYNEIAIDVAVNDADVALSCTSGGTVAWGEESGADDEVCYTVDSRGCDFTTPQDRTFGIDGSSTMCGSDTFAIDEETLVAGQDFNIAGEATVTTTNGSRTCAYDLDVTIDSVRGDGAEYSVTVQGQLCDRRTFASSFDVAVEGNIEVSSGS